MPTVTVVSTAFEILARAEAEALGLAGLRIAVVPHPVGQRSAEELQTWGERLVPASIKALTGRSDPEHEPTDGKGGP